MRPIEGNPYVSETSLRPALRACVSLQLVLPELIATLYSSNRMYNLPLAVYPFTPSIPFPPLLAHLLIHATCDIIVAVKKVTQNLAVLGT